MYSFGVLAYELLSDSAPFAGLIIEDLNHQHVYEAAPRLDIASQQLSFLEEECLYKMSKARANPPILCTGLLQPKKRRLVLTRYGWQQ